MDLRMCGPGGNVSANLAKIAESRMRSERDGGNGYALVQVDLSPDQLKQARRDLWRCLMQHHPELDFEGNGDASETDGIGKVDCLPDSCLSLQVLPCFRKLFAHMLGADPDQLVSTMDVPQYVPPGSGQPYMGLTVGNTGIVGLLCLSSQQVTSGGDCALPGSLLLYNTKQPEHRGRDRVILPRNPVDGLHPWLGLRIGFWPRHSDKFRSPRIMRRHLFLRGRFGLHFHQSPGADMIAIRRERAKFLTENPQSRFFVPPVEESADEGQALYLTERQLFFDRGSQTLKFTSRRKPKLVPEGKRSDGSPGLGEETGRRRPLPGAARSGANTCHVSGDGKGRNFSAVPKRRANRTSGCSHESVEGSLGSAAAETEATDASWVERAQSLSTRDRTAARCNESDVCGTPPPLRDSTAGTRRRQLERDSGVGSGSSRAPPGLPPSSSPEASDQQLAAKRARRESFAEEAERPERHEGRYPLTDLVYDSMYDDSDDSDEESPRVPRRVSRAPVPERREDCSEALSSLPFDRGVHLLKALSQDKVAVCTRKQGAIHLSPGVKISSLVFCNLQGLDGVRRTWNSGEMERSRAFVAFCSLPDRVYEVRGASNAYDLVRVAVCGLAKSTSSKVARACSLYTLSDFHKEGRSLEGVECEKDRLYWVLRAPKLTPAEGYPAFFDLRQHNRKGRASLREWRELTMREAALQKIEWDNKARKLLGGPARGIGGRLHRQPQQQVEREKGKQDHMAFQLLESLCRKEHRAARGRRIPVHLHMLTVDQVLDRHGAAVRDVFRICADLAAGRATEKDAARRRLGCIVREQMQLIDLMKTHEQMRLAYGVFRLSSGDLFLHVIMARPEAFQQLVKEVREEYHL